VTLLDVDGLGAGYGDFEVLLNVDLRIDVGQAVALVGANGAGKTTLLRCLAGGLAPTAGRVRFDGTDITAAPPHERIRLGVAIVPEGRRLFPSLTAEENIKVGAVRGKPSPWPLQRIYDVFPLLVRCRGRKAGTLSGGEQQAVAIARALVSGPRLLLLDEVSLGLAPVVVDALYDTLDELRTAGTTLLLVEHDIDRARSACDEVVCLLEGRMALRANAATVSRDDIVRAYFGGADQRSDFGGAEQRGNLGGAEQRGNLGDGVGL
jgi:branched-chain amino acid transport system ATP-binding protein